MDLEFNKNDDVMRLLISQLEQKLNKVYLGGGKSRIDKMHEQGKMTARERIDYLLDDNAKRIEVGAFAGEDMYKEHGGCPSGGVVVVIVGGGGTKDVIDNNICRQKRYTLDTIIPQKAIMYMQQNIR